MPAFIARTAVTAGSLAAAFGVSAGLLPVRMAIPLCAALAVTGFLFSRSRLDGRFLAAGALSTLAPGLLLLVPNASADSLYAAAYAVTQVGMVWGVVLPWWGTRSPLLDGWLARVNVPVVAGLILGLTLLAFLARWALNGPFAYVVDENLYLFQAARILDGSKGVPLDETLRPFFAIRQTFVHEGYLNGQYPPGWPAVLAGFRMIGLEPFAGLVMYTLTLVGVAALARAIRAEWSEASLAVTLTGLCYTQVVVATSYYSHATATAFALAAGLSFLAAARRRGGAGLRMWIVGGACVGMVGAIRPLTGLVTLVALGWWLVSTGMLSRGRARAFVAAGVGAAIPGVLLLAYNFRTTGHPLRFGYDLAHGGLQALGFGTRGEIWYTVDGLPVNRVVEFTPLDGVGQFLTTLGDGIVHFWPGGLIVVLVAIGIRTGFAIRSRVLIPFLFLPAVYSVYFYSNVRFMLELLPFAMVATVFWAQQLREKGERVNHLVCWLTVGLTIAVGAGRFTLNRPLADSRRVYFEAVERTTKRWGPLLVFVAQERADASTSGAIEHGLEALYWYNSREFGGNVIVGRDVETLRPVIRDRFPRHVPVRLVTGPEGSDSHWEPPRVELLSIAPSIEVSSADADVMQEVAR